MLISISEALYDRYRPTFSEFTKPKKIVPRETVYFKQIQLAFFWVQFLTNAFTVVFADSSAKQDYPLVDDFAKRRSYATPTIVWSKDNWIIADLQKAHRAAKKLPDKQGKFSLRNYFYNKAPRKTYQAAFYKEVNRISKACCVYSNDSVLEGLLRDQKYDI